MEERALAGRVYVVRHGESTWNAERRWAGHGDPPLTDTGREQARGAANALRPIGFDRVASSNLVRARETAAILSEALALPLEPPDARFDERFAGPMRGMTSAEIERRWPGLLERWDAGRIIEIEGGEAWGDFVARALAGLAALRRRSGATLLVTHMGVQRAIEHGLGRPLGRYDNLAGFWVEADVTAASP